MLKILVSIPAEVDNQGSSFGFSCPSFLTNLDPHQFDYRILTNDSPARMSELANDIRSLASPERDFLLVLCVMDMNGLAESVYSFLEANIGFETNVDLNFDDPQDKSGCVFIRIVDEKEGELLKKATGRSLN